MNKCIALLQARMSSTRLPGKVLMPLAEQPMLLRQVNRIKQAKSLDGIVVCTSQEKSDDPIAEFCRRNHIDCFRGSLNNVLSRVVDAAKKFPSEHYVRLTADCPLSDPEIIDSVVNQHCAEKNDFTSNCMPYTLPDGLDVEVMSSGTLRKIDNLASLEEHFEHVTKYVYQNTGSFKLGNFEYSRDYSKNRWTVDYPEDFTLVQHVFEHFKDNEFFGLEEIVQFLEQNPDIKAINQKYME